ncbi:Histone deacetylase interacting [Penicillium bovifimosum]|uniref:Histone deacetylase interacting n=1 Tax=Penicillium bovifimosum TaxID=126998 RepID=A0A9W9GNF7_9EURO|nr:Histone deacetylase interacting [Penicillium bovifimosum]KAJ5124881.1 Histone deacetylase interacting [Penicillium bovifimosum]
MSSFNKNMVVIPITAASDGDVSTWPGSPYTHRDDDSWRQKLAENWVKDAGACQQEKEAAVLREKRHNRFVEKCVNNPAWARGLSKDQVDEANQRFRSWVAGTGAVAGAGSEGASAPAGQDVEMAE